MNAPAVLRQVTLDDKYALERGPVFLTAMQALVRLPMLQRARDRAAGLNTAGYVSGYRGSPLGGLDQALWQARAHLEAHHVVFEPGVNEDLAATAIWGTQQLALFRGARYDGVFGMWYGKGPGVDRSGDVLKHANFAGTARHGGVLAVAGDDHAAKSSAHAHQSEHVFKACAMPVLAPASVQDILDFGLHGWAMSRYSGCWVALKLVGDLAESSASVVLDPDRVRVRLPTDFELPPDGLSLRWPDPVHAQEYRMHQYKVYAALAYARANGLDRVVWDSPRARLGIITAGKSYLDVRQALDDLGIDEAAAREIGIRLYKAGMTWPLEAEGVRRFAEGLEEILVVEEKRHLIEYQIKEELYNWREDVRPRVVGKFDEKGEWALPHGEWLLPPLMDHNPTIVARAIAARLARFYASSRISDRLAYLDDKTRSLGAAPTVISRAPWFCPGCPHNASTRVPEGSVALAGVGCHLMAMWMGRQTQTVSHMGGEGATWTGVRRFTDTPHVFVNMGDGTYYHSGSLAIRAAVAARTPVTYKILYNDAVAMTGGQPVEGPLSVPRIVRQLADEGVGRIVVVAEEPERYRGDAGLPPGVPVLAREALERVQRELREYPDVSAIVYDQTCAAEKRRRRRRGELADPARRVWIDPEVCESCGDCAAKSNCLAVVRLETPLGARHAIDQHACNKDFGCLAGHCPALVTVEGGALRKPATASLDEAALPALPAPAIPQPGEPYGILVAGVGGTGVVTIGAILGMAAHLEGKGATVLDQAGLAQKGGAVASHVRICAAPEKLHAARIATGEADIVLGCDLVTTASCETLACMREGTTRAVVNVAPAATGELLLAPERRFPAAELRAAVERALAPGAAEYVDAHRLAVALTGDPITANMLLLGYAWQRSLVPLAEEAILRAIELNGVAVETNQRAFRWGRRAAADPQGVARIAGADAPPLELDALIEDRARRLATYQDERLAERYRALIARVRTVEAGRVGATALAEAAARGYFRLLAHKDEYEVARVFASAAFRARLDAAFEGDYRVRWHVAPAWLGARDPRTGETRKRALG
ncbi:MAG: indolepyruvate ferredoxin oxidoreductase family protein, partial [Burkholderiales bacterium]|nr:indolepyruvate ferredoxin oxidoreductase family protein [Burkholderiales bacterium]